MLNLGAFSNIDEISKQDFDVLVKSYNLEVYTQEAIQKYVTDISNLMEKSEEGGELTGDEKNAIEIAKAEISNLKKYTVLDVIEGKLVKVPLYVQSQMVDIEKGVYVDNPVNRKLGRVGRQWGGKKEEDKGKGKDDTDKKFNEDFRKKITDHMDDEGFYDIVAEVAGEPEDDGESESALIDRLSKLPKEKQKLMMEKLVKKKETKNYYNEHNVHKGYITLSKDMDHKPYGKLSTIKTKVESSQLSEEEKHYISKLPKFEQKYDTIPKYNPEKTEKNYILETPYGKFFVDTQGYDYPRYMKKIL